MHGFYFICELNRTTEIEEGQVTSNKFSKCIGILAGTLALCFFINIRFLCAESVNLPKQHDPVIQKRLPAEDVLKPDTGLKKPDLISSGDIKEPFPEDPMADSSQVLERDMLKLQF